MLSMSSKNPSIISSASSMSYRSKPNSYSEAKEFKLFFFCLKAFDGGGGGPFDPCELGMCLLTASIEG